MLNGNGLEMVGWFYQNIKIGLLGHGYCDGRSRCKDKLGDDMSGNEAGSIFVYFVA